MKFRPAILFLVLSLVLSGPPALAGSTQHRQGPSDIEPAKAGGPKAESPRDAAARLAADARAQGASVASLIELARAHEQDGDPARALATLELARGHAPRNAAVRGEVDRLRTALGSPAEAEGWRAPFRWLTIGEWAAVLACAAAALGGLALAHGLRGTPATGRRWRKGIAAALVLLMATSVTGLAVQSVRLEEGIVHVSGAPLLVSPTSAAQAAGVLRAGEQVTIEGSHLQYLLVRSRSGPVGWLPDSSVTSLNGMPPAPAAKAAKPSSPRE